MLAAFVVWLRRKYMDREEGRGQWQAYWSEVTTPPPGVRPPSSPAPDGLDWAE